MTQRAGQLLREYAVETAVLLGAIGQTLASDAAREFEWRQACRVDFNYETDVCDDIVYRSAREKYPQEYSAVDAAFTLAEVWREPVRSFVPACIVLFVGAWSDRTGRRRAVILVPLLGELVAISALLITLAANTGLVTIALTRALPGLFGDSTVLLVGALSHIADWSDLRSRTFRIGRLTIAVAATNPVALVAARLIYSPGQYLGLFVPSWVLSLIAFVVAIYFIKDKEPRPLPENPIRNFFNPKSALESFNVLFKKRSGYLRMAVLLILIINIFNNGSLKGESVVIFQYVRRFKLELKDIFLLKMYGHIIIFLGTIITMSVLVKRLKIKDYILGIISAVDRIISNLCFAFAPSSVYLYVFTTFEFFLACNAMAFRSMASKLVAGDELAKLLSVFGFTDLIFPSAFAALYGFFYTYTAEKFVGAFFFLSASFVAPIIIFYIVINFVTRQTEEVKPNPENETPKENVAPSTSNAEHGEKHVTVEL